jgi:Ca2+-binding EF-hand superfamily protein
MLSLSLQQLLLFLSLTLHSSYQAVHNHRPSKESGERLSDGAFSPRDHKHGSGEEHDNSFDHEAILGSRKDAEEYDDLPPEEAKRRLGVLLGKMDRNLDEQIDRKELYAWILRSFKSLSEEDSKDRFDDADEDMDGLVTWAEYKAEEYDFGEEEVDLEDPEMAEEWKLMEEDRFLFMAADISGDGSLDVKEFLSFSHPEEDPAMRPHVLAQVLKEKDTDGDGELSFQEYVGDRGQGKDKEWLISEKERFDSELDKNGDSNMNTEEILAWIIPSNEEIATDEVDHLFSGADEDGNEQLTFEEVLNNHDLFVGSEATDYGDHLHNLHKFEDEL